MSRRSPRRSRSELPGASGFLVVDKPAGRTSHDVVDEARRWLGTRRVGHLGTLDPQATGVLPLAIRQATKLIPFIESKTEGLRRHDRARDRDRHPRRRGRGPAAPRGAASRPRGSRGRTVPFPRGDIQQVPPMYSAVKKDGIPLHRLARQGIDVEREPKWITIESLELTRFESPAFDVRVRCSAGTYVRVLAADLGRICSGVGLIWRGLRRTAERAVPDRAGAQLCAVRRGGSLAKARGRADLAGGRPGVSGGYGVRGAAAEAPERR